MANNKNTIYQIRFDSGSAHEVSEDFSLPDYMSEVRQIISCSATVLPENKYIDQSDVTLSGLVTYTVLYVGNDGTLSAAPLNSEYSVKVSCPAANMAGLSQDMITSVTTLTSVNCRATGPRRLVLTSRMYSKIFSTLGTDHTESINISSSDGNSGLRTADELSLERHSIDVESSNILSGRATGNLSGEFREREGTKIIACGASAGISDIRVDGRDVTLKGDAYIHCLVTDADGVYKSVRIKSPLEERLTVGTPIPSGDEKKSACASVRCASVSISGGDGGLFTWDLEYDIDVTHTTDVTATVTDDIYSTEYETLTEELCLSSLLCLKNGNSRLSVNGTKQISAGSEKRICYSTGRVVTDRTECSADGKITVNGNCTVQVVISEDGRISVEDVTLPIKFECDCKARNGKCHVICDANVMYTDARLEGDRLSVDAELCMTVFAYAAEKTDCISACTMDRDRPVREKDNCVKIYFPEDGEDMWNIGKKYHCPVGNLAAVGESGPVVIMK